MTGETFILRAWNVHVMGHGFHVEYAASRGQALARAWRSDIFSHMTFKEFLRIANAANVGGGPFFGREITVNGRAAYMVDRNRAYIRYVNPLSATVLSAHPYNVEPEDVRPDEYRKMVASSSPDRMGGAA